MTATLLDAVPVVPRNRLRDRALAVGAVGLAGVASLMLQPLPDAARQAMAGIAHWPEAGLRALQLINPALLVILAAVAGAWSAHRVGLRSVLAGTAERNAMAPVLCASVFAGVLLGALLGGVDHGWAPWLGADWQRLLHSDAGQGPPLPVRLLYGGLAEEVMLRWGLMSVLALALGRLVGRQTALAMGIAVVLCALLFAVAHLPALMSVIEPSPGLIARTLALNGLAGLAYGLWFCRHHLEAAMALHAATHLGMALAGSILG